MNSSTLTSNAALVLVLALSLTYCKTIPTTAELESLTKVIELEKGPCYGECSIFTLTIYENGIIQYKGEEFTEKKGVFIKTMPQNDLRKLVKSFRDAGFFSFQEAYRSNIPDLQTISITFNDGGRSKTVVGKDNRPEALMELQSQLEKIADTKDDWKKKSDKGGEGDEASKEIIVNLVKGVSTEEWLDKYKAQKVQLKETLSPTGNYILITFDTEITSPEDMLNNIRQDPDVFSAEFNTTEIYNR